MANKNLPRPTEGELEILQVLWALGPASVRQVNDALSANRSVGYTTTLKLMQIMVDKGLLARDTSERTHIYRAVVAERDTRQNLLQNLVDQAFGGSAMDLVIQALGSHRATPEELEEIKALIERLEKDE
jgi:predicted transcriptional regulator